MAARLVVRGMVATSVLFSTLLHAADTRVLKQGYLQNRYGVNILDYYYYFHFPFSTAMRCRYANQEKRSIGYHRGKLHFWKRESEAAASHPTTSSSSPPLRITFPFPFQPN